MFKKNKNTKSEEITEYKNWDGGVYAYSDGSISSRFNEDQKRILSECLKKNYAPDSYAYPSVSAETMRYIKSYAFTEPYGNETVTPVMIWKIVHTDLTPFKVKACIISASYGYELVDEIENIGLYSEEILMIVAIAFRYKANLLKYIKPDIDVDSLYSILDKKTKGKCYKEIIDKEFRKDNPLYF